MLLPSGWYAVADARELSAKKPLSICFSEKQLVLWRKANGSPVAMLDQCPHRSARLSIGKVRSDRIQCPFHGFQFAEDGRCTLVPETQKAAANLRAKTFPVFEEHGFLWIWHGQKDPSPKPPWFEMLSTGKWSFSRQNTQWPTHITRCIENQLDYAHLPFVHHNTIGQNVDVTQSMRFETGEDFIKFYPPASGTADTAGGLIEFRFPNIWMLTIVPGKFAQMMAFVPVRNDLTKLYLRGYQSFVVIPGFRTIIDTIGAWQSHIILNQDRNVVLSQHPINSVDAADEVLYPSDGAVSSFRRRWVATQE